MNLEEWLKGLNPPVLLSSFVAIVTAICVLWAALRGHRVTEKKVGADATTGNFKNLHDGFDLLIKELQEERHELRTLIKDQTTTITGQSAEIKAQSVTISQQTERMAKQNEELITNRGTIQSLRKEVSNLETKFDTLQAYLIDVLATMRAAGQEPPPPPEGMRGNG